MTGREVLRAAAAIVLTTLLAGGPARAAGLSLDVLMQALRAPAERHATFEETKEIALLNGPLVRRGTLDYVRPDRLTMQVDTPFFERVEVVGGEVALIRRSGTARVTLAAEPLLAAWIESLRATLSGDAALLQRHFDVRVDGVPGDWHLELTPREPALRERIERVGIGGRGADVLRFEIDEAKGDRTRIVIVPRGPK